MILNTIAEKLKRRSKDDFKGRHFEAWLHCAGGGLVICGIRSATETLNRAGDQDVSDHFPREEEHAEDRRIPILQNRASNCRRVRSDAVAAKRVWLLRRVDRQ